MTKAHRKGSERRRRIPVHQSAVASPRRGTVPRHLNPARTPELRFPAVVALALVILPACGGSGPSVPIGLPPPPPPPPPLDDHGDERETATEIGPNSSTEGALETSGDVDFFRLDVPSPGGYLTIGTAGDTDTVGTLFHPDGETRSDDDADGSNFVIATPRLPGGTYFIEVKGFCGAAAGCATGEYVLHAALETNENDDHGDTQRTATAIAPDSSTPGVLEIGPDVDVFRFEVPSSDGYLTIQTTGQHATSGVLHLPDGSTLFNSLGGAGLNFQIVTGLVPSGTYFVEVFQFVPHPGPTFPLQTVEAREYVLEVAFNRVPPDQHGDRHGTATRVGPNSSTRGVLQSPEDRDFFRFEVPSSGGYLTIETTGTADTVGTLYLRDGTVRSDDDGGDGLNFRIITGLVPGGTYVVEVGAFAFEGFPSGEFRIGEYVLHVSVDVIRAGAD